MVRLYALSAAARLVLVMLPLAVCTPVLYVSL